MLILGLFYLQIFCKKTQKHEKKYGKIKVLQIVQIDQSKVLPYKQKMSDEQITFCLKGFGIQVQQEVDQVIAAYKANNYQLAEDYLTKKKWNEFLQKVTVKSQILYRFPPQKAHPLNTYSQHINAVIYGPCGSGKTSVINNICGTNFQSKQSVESLTRDVVQVKTQYQYTPEFILYDTPGTTATKDKLEHALFLKEILIWKPINAIFIVVEYIKRADLLLAAIMAQLDLLHKYKENVVFLVTNFDKAQNSTLIKDSLCKTLDELKLKNNIIFFSNKNCEKKKLCDLLYGYAIAKEKVKIQITTQEFLLKFNLTPKVGEHIFLEKDLIKARQQMKQITEIYVNNAKLITSGDKEAILQDFEVVLKNQLIEVLNKFQQQFKQTMIGCQFYESFYTLQKDILDKSLQFQKCVRSSQSYKYIQNQATGQKTDIRDLIKECPKCKQIWFRIESCPNTYCGKRPSCFFDFLKRSSICYTIKRQGKFISYQLTQKQNNIKSNKDKQIEFKQKFSEQTKKAQLKKKIQQKDNKIANKDVVFKPRGCGQAMNFQTLPRLINIETILKEWYQVSSMEQVISIVQRNRDLEKQRLKLEAGIRNKIYRF